MLGAFDLRGGEGAGRLFGREFGGFVSRVRSPARWKNRSALTRLSSCRTCLHSSTSPPVADPLPYPCGPALPLLPAAPSRPPSQLVESCRTCLHSSTTPPVTDPLPCPCSPALPLLPAAPPQPTRPARGLGASGPVMFGNAPVGIPADGAKAPAHAIGIPYPLRPFFPTQREEAMGADSQALALSFFPSGILFPRPRIGPFRGESRTAMFTPPAGRRSGPARTPGVSGSRPDRRARAGDRSPRGAGRAATRASALFPPA